MHGTGMHTRCAAISYSMRHGAKLDIANAQHVSTELVATITDSAVMHVQSGTGTSAHIRPPRRLDWNKSTMEHDGGLSVVRNRRDC